MQNSDDDDRRHYQTHDPQILSPSSAEVACGQMTDEEVAYLSVGHFAALNEHLIEVRLIVDVFCKQHGFVYVPRLALGRYPRIRVTRPGAVEIWFDLSMDLDDHGNRFEQFRPDLPYGLLAGANVDVPEGSMVTRNFTRFWCFEHKPFHEVCHFLRSEMESCLPTLEAWTVQRLKNEGEETTFPSTP